ncbi:UDP-2,3-diacylglucosamine diphosphatase [Thauera sinica]|uniref:UDP-2,3-diacylglucosamine hydrolase n=1 Tax=Thauera sinica TaxID=2665146 RepID=A0ABW1AUH6_9RHOO|nr:UDP-2,3-diacylglucosamine diphosphatase [Thauera sp. K11]ATE62465.1 UDP-2,3-diacylglucosamine diphosphatase [Thauera sp. K11]
MPDAVAAALPAFFVSDLHLSDERPDTVDAFLGFLDGPARDAASLFILGDLFEYWAGDDDLDAPFNRHIGAALRAVADHGVQLFFMTGNRDLLAGEGFARATGARLLEDPSLVAFGSGGAPVLLSHGDALCTDDVAYQAYRHQVRDPAWQRGFLSQPLAARKAFIEGLRQKSEMAKREKALDIMDVNADAVAALLRASGYPMLIHGHTHRPARHEHLVDGRTCVRWVLADWHGAASWLRVDGNGVTAHGATTR